MNIWFARTAGAGLLILAGMIVGSWATTSRFRPALDAAQDQVAACAAARNNLAGLAAEQGKALGDLALAANERQARAKQGMEEARTNANFDYGAANRLLQERTGGDQCAAASSIIDKELDL
ncbi:hypothetical protein [Pseudomonas oryzicola]|uniref:DUF2514 family protein n=1 Tax=Pseudomonas oryzicola TaxID=485876 RepID=A0ABS6Q9S1_9PSED|nr:hypothetical protein [Pseudomonas oryzicola]MBV4490943.1 hypothetical protein [Pseudomonas oryzicola]